jgi:hypothetical protein
MHICSGRREEPWRGLLAGLISGVAATIAMSMFQSAWNATTQRRFPSKNNSDALARCPSPQPNDVETTRMLVDRVAVLGGFEFSDAASAETALALHYGIGAAGAYAYFLFRNVALPRFHKEHPLLTGAVFGAAFFLTADLAVLPLLGFPNKGSRSPLGTQFYGFSSHVVYGVTAAATCNLVGKFL